MTRRTLLALAIAITIGGTVAFVRQAPPPAAGSLARLMPPGALLALEARDLARLVADWNGSPEKAAWLTSDTYQAFVRSRLSLRLREAQQEFTAAAGVPPGMDLLSQVAGAESILGVYDIGTLELLYVTRLPAARAVENALWRARATYQPRDAGGTRFYVRSDPQSKRTVAIGVRDDYLVLATREDLVAGALTLMSSPAAASVAGERWYTGAVGAAGPSGDVRLVMHLEALAKTPHFRSYWVQRNPGEIARFSSGIADLTRSADGLREERVLLRGAETPAPDGGGGAVDRMLRLVPDGAGLYRAWAAPTGEQAAALVMKKVIAPGPDSVGRDLTAPRVELGEGVTGSGADLETRIDQEIRAAGPPRYRVDALQRLIGAGALTGLLHVERTRTGADPVFFYRDAVIVLERSDAWAQGAATAALEQLVAPVWTRAPGLRWSEETSGAVRFSRLDGLERLAVAERGRLLFISNDPALLGLVLASTSPAAADARATYAAGFRHALERDRFAAMMGYIDAAAVGASPEPPFFSGNLASLSRTLRRVDAASIAERDEGARVTQTVTYSVR